MATNTKMMTAKVLFDIKSKEEWSNDITIYPRGYAMLSYDIQHNNAMFMKIADGNNPWFDLPYLNKTELNSQGEINLNNLTLDTREDPSDASHRIIQLTYNGEAKSSISIPDVMTIESSVDGNSTIYTIKQGSEILFTFSSALTEDTVVRNKIKKNQLINIEDKTLVINTTIK